VANRAGTQHGVIERPVGRQAPWVSDDITGDELDRQTINELRTLPEGLALATARHMVAIEQALEDEDFDTARAHSDYVRKQAGRVAAVREACAIVHYASGDFAQALSDFRAVSRMRGGGGYAPIMADCERGLRRPQRAVDLLRGLEGPQPRGSQAADVSTRVEGLIVLAGARADLGQDEAAVLTLKVPELTRLPAGTQRARLQYAYADALLRVGRSVEAQEWMERAAGSDIDGATNAEERCLELAAINE
jgi:tetratricopeptide (TPR) repeat protein